MDETAQPSITRLPFPPITRSHILHCSYHSWHPKYRSITPKARLIPLTAPFLAYLRSDGIILPPDQDDPNIDFSSTDTDSGIFSSTSTPTASDSDSDSDSDSEPNPDPSTQWPELHQKVKSTIAELGGNVVPKINWSAPKDATFMNTTNSMECQNANDVYCLLKGSDFVTHDLEQVFDDCVPSESNDKNDGNVDADSIPYHLVLRKTIPALVPSLEFRCFVRSRTLLCMCQRDLNFYNFLPELVPTLRPLIQKFFDDRLKQTFEDENFVFDVYIPPPHKKVWLIDINPWAPRTDPLIFSWLEILQMTVPSPSAVVSESNGIMNGISDGDAHKDGGGSEDEDDDNDEEDIFTPEFRLVNRDDPEAYAFNTPRYSAHKMPKDVVDASGGGEAGLREFMGRWREIMREQGGEDGANGGR
ncbi:MAG: hypothetical protein Q9169_006532 [Polycauliona sp. 2 TL-2023]